MEPRDSLQILLRVSVREIALIVTLGLYTSDSSSIPKSVLITRSFSEFLNAKNQPGYSFAPLTSFLETGFQESGKTTFLTKSKTALSIASISSPSVLRIYPGMRYPIMSG